MSDTKYELRVSVAGLQPINIPLKERKPDCVYSDPFGNVLIIITQIPASLQAEAGAFLKKILDHP
jgi:hypothetical protein